ncbi:MAG: histone [Chlamydiae bacterium]|nr:histone [Chlamydiota bacterium]
MALKETVDQLQELLDAVTKDLEKGAKGNKAASQRVRTGTVKLEKIAKLYRKQSVAFEKTAKTKPAKPAKAAKPAAKAAKKPAAKPAKKPGRK